MWLTWGLFFPFYSTIGLEYTLGSIGILKTFLNWLEFFPNDWWLVKDMQFKRTLQHFDCLTRSRISSSFRALLNSFLLRIVQTFWNVSLLKLIVVTLTIKYPIENSIVWVKNIWSSFSLLSFKRLGESKNWKNYTETKQS